MASQSARLKQLIAVAFVAGGFGFPHGNGWMASMKQGDFEATEVRLSSGREALDIEWRNGASNRFHADQLRQACRCAECVRARLDGDFSPVKEVAIASVAPVGSYALNVQFSDGHARGIYPWSYLREIAARA